VGSEQYENNRLGRDILHLHTRDMRNLASERYGKFRKRRHAETAKHATIEIRPLKTMEYSKRENTEERSIQQEI